MTSFPLLLVAVVVLLSLAPAYPAQYVGSVACKACHADIYDRWKDTLHNQSQQELTLTNDTVVVDWSGQVTLKAPDIPEVILKLSEPSRGSHLVTLVDRTDVKKSVTYQVVRTYGGWGWKQRYLIKVGNSHYILPLQWNQAASRWVPYNLQNWYNRDGSLKELNPANSFEKNCAGCHNTGLVLTKGPTGEFLSNYVELNIGCEKCHGPGEDHVKAGGRREAIINPRKLPYERSLEVCGQCHSRGKSLPNGTHDFPWDDENNRPYEIGKPLREYFSARPGLWGDPEAHSKAHHQQWLDFLKSSHFSPGRLACFDCHDPHGSAARFQMVRRDDNNSLCLSCHRGDKRFATIDDIRGHTRHNYAPETVGLSRCSTCHMVKTASSAEAGDIHSHTFKIIAPEVSLKQFREVGGRPGAAVIPNSCNGCHAGWKDDLAGFEAGVAAYNRLFGGVR